MVTGTGAETGGRGKRRGFKGKRKQGVEDKKHSKHGSEALWLGVGIMGP